MSILHGASNLSIYNGTFVAQTASGGHDAENQVMKFLAGHVIDVAIPDGSRQSELSTCHPSTRVLVLDTVKRWATSSGQPPILWLNGGAGAGKSTIMRTLVRGWHEAGHVTVAACFFCYQAEPCGEERGAFVPTLAYQLAQTIPSTKKTITHAIASDPALLKKSIETQFSQLIINPLAGIMAGMHRPVVIIVDGLDECYLGQVPNRDREEWEEHAILNAISFACQRLRNTPVRFLIASRREHQIRTDFASDILRNITVEITLDGSYTPEEDIETFLRDRFQLISQQHASEGEPNWPRDDLIISLVRRSSGHFIYPSLVLEFVENSRSADPKRHLEILCCSGNIAGGQTPEIRPLVLLDQLYHRILDSTLPDCRKSMFDILGTLCYRWGKLNGSYGRLFGGSLHAQSPAFLERLLFMQRNEVRTCLIDLHSILDVPQSGEQSKTHPVRIKHATLCEFLANRTRSGKSCIDKARAHLYRQRTLMRHVLIIVSCHITTYDEAAVIRLFMQGFMQMFTMAGQASHLFMPSKSLKEGLEALMSENDGHFRQYLAGIKMPPPVENRRFLLSRLVEPEEELAMVRYLKGCNIPRIEPDFFRRAANLTYLESQIRLLTFAASQPKTH